MATVPPCSEHGAKSTFDARWKDAQSIAQRVASLEHDLSAFTAIDITELYEQLLFRYFGVRKTARSKTAQRFLKKTEELCEKRGIDPELYITAQMDALKPWLMEPAQVARKMGFRANMLSGENAARRYNGYIITAYARMRHVSVRALDAQSFEGKLFLRAYADELEIIGDYVAEVYAGGVQTYDSIVASEPRSLGWNVLVGVGGEQAQNVREQIRNLYGKKYLVVIRRLIRFKVARAICERYRKGLSVRLGAREEFRWIDLAGILVRVAPVRQRADSSDLTGIPGA